MSKQKNIIASCVINNNTVYKNGVKLFENQDTALPSFLLAVYDHFSLNYPKFYKMDNLSKLGWLASEILLKEEDIKSIKPEEMAIILLNANASLDTDIKYYDTVNDIASPAVFVYTLPNIVIGEISIRNNFKGENAFFIFDKFNAVFIEGYVNTILETGMAKLCICGWVDVLEENYKAVLFLTGEAEAGSIFSTGVINKIYVEGDS